MRTCSVGTLFSLVLLAMLPLSVHAAGESIDLAPERFAEGDNVRVYGEGFEPSYRTTSGERRYVYVLVYFSSEPAEVGDAIDDVVENYELVDQKERVGENGEWKVSFTVPRKLTDGERDKSVYGGTYYIYVTYKDDFIIAAKAECEVKEPSCCCPRPLPYWAYSLSSFCWPSSCYDCCPSPWYDPCRSSWYGYYPTPWDDGCYPYGGRYHYTYPPLPVVVPDE